MKTTFIGWYLDIGCSDLNKSLLEIKNRGIGRIPLSNLIPEEFNEYFDETTILSLTHDGLSIEEVRYDDGSNELFVFIK